MRWGILLAAAMALSSCRPEVLPGRDRFRGYFAPVFSADGRHIYYVLRETEGRSWGPGWEHFTPPAYARASKDIFSLHRHELSSGRDEVLKTWPDSPLVGKEIRTYRNQLYTFPHVHLRLHDDGPLEYEIAVTVPSRPAGTTWRSYRRWDPGKGAFSGSAEWRREGCEFKGYLEDKLRGGLEAVTLPGPESFPSAIAVIDHRQEAFRVLLASPEFDRIYPDGVPERIVYEGSQRKEIDRLRSLRTAYAEALEGFLRAGLPEGEALLAANREMQRLGFFPKPTTITARRLVPGGESPPDVPTFDISEMEVRVGLFRDIAEALSEPGTPVEKSLGKYVRHRDYGTSKLINAYLEGGGTVFRIRYREGTFELTTRRPD
jgi:hypothetical protein